MSKKVIFQPSKSAVAQIAQLPDMDIEEIKSLWRKVYRSEPPTHIRTFLERRLAYRLQEQEFRRAHQTEADKNDRRIAAIMQTGKKPLRDRYPQPIPGTVLSRLYRDEEYRVTVTHDGQYEFEGRIYKSLSVIAREITGTQWSGPLFFGLRKEVYKSKTKGRKS